MKQQILIVDDSKSIRQTIKMILEETGDDCVEAENGLSAIERLKEGGVDLVLCDVNMPEMDGITFLEKVRHDSSLQSYAQVPFVMLTTESGQDKKKRGRELDVDSWLVKPFRPDELIRVIDSVREGRNNPLPEEGEKKSAAPHEKFSITEKHDDDFITILFSGELTVYSVEEARIYMLNILQTYTEINLDFSGIQRIDTAGFQFMKAIIFSADEFEGRISILHMSDDVKRIFALYGESGYEGVL